MDDKHLNLMDRVLESAKADLTSSDLWRGELEVVEELRGIQAILL